MTGKFSGYNAAMPPPTIIIPDTGPLIHLAAGNLLHVLPAMGRLVVPDVILLEATRLPDKPWAREISAWFAAAAVEVVHTDIGNMFRDALASRGKLPRNAGELGIIEWLREGLEAPHGEALVVYEDVLVPPLIMEKPFAADVTALTTLNFLELAEARGLISSAEAAWDAIAEVAPTASPMSRRSTRKPAP